MLAAVTSTTNNSPRVSTARWRLRPLTFLPASQPRLTLGTVSAARTDCESMIAADGAGPRPAATRTCSRSTSWTRCRVPSAAHLVNHQYTVPGGGKSLGSSRQAQPVRTR